MFENHPKQKLHSYQKTDDYNKSVNFLTQDHDNIDILQICPDNVLKSTVLGTGREDLLHDYSCGLAKGMDFLHTYSHLY